MTNQIVTKLSSEVLELSSSVDAGSASGGDGGSGDVGVVVPALGNAWYHSVNTRILLEQREGPRRVVN